MRKSIEIFVKQNPIFEAECPNSDCKKMIRIKSKELFAVPVYKMVCPHCDSDVEWNTNEFADDFEKQLKDLGISWK